LPILQTILSRLEAIEAKVGVKESAEANTSQHGSAEEIPRSIKGFDTYCQLFLNPFVAACDKLG
jgi:hypothetical protein